MNLFAPPRQPPLGPWHWGPPRGAPQKKSGAGGGFGTLIQASQAFRLFTQTGYSSLADSIIIPFNPHNMCIRQDASVFQI